MNSKTHPIIDAFLKGRFSLLLTTMVGMFFLVPLFGKSQGMIDEVFGWFSIAVMASCLRSISQSRRFYIFMVVLTVLNVLLGGSEILASNEPGHFVLAVVLFRTIYYVLVFFSIMRFVLNNDPVTLDKICGAISAYLIMGLAWSSIYMLFHTLNPESFSVPVELLSSETVNSYWSIYFSFTTLTTLGYGDITPTTPLTQSYAVMEAAIGQVFLAVIVARLIALQITHQREQE